MKKEKNWIIIDVRNSFAVRGAGKKTLRFSTEDVAREVAEQLLSPKDFILFDIKINLGL